MTRWFIAIAICVFAAVPLQGAVPHWSDSLELGVQRAGCVVTGSIAKEESIASPSPRSTSPYPWKRVTINVHEVLRGPLTPQITYMVPQYTDDLPKTDAGPGEDAIFLLVRGSRYVKSSHGFVWDPLYADVAWTLEQMERGSGAISLEPANLRNIPNMGLQPFLRRAEVMDVAWANIFRPPSPLVQTLCTLPGTPFPAWMSIITVPVNERLEQLGKVWSFSANPTLRWNALLICRAHKSAEHILAVRRLANWPGTGEIVDVTRAVALSQLVDWGETVDWKRLGEGVSSWRSGSPIMWISALTVLIFPALYWLRSRRRLNRGWVSRVIMTAWLVAICITGAAWIRSYALLDAVEVGPMQAGLVRGNIFIVGLDRWNDALHRSPFRTVLPLSLPGVAEASLHSWRIDFSAWRWGLMDAWGHHSAGEDTFPAWDGHFVLWFPFWLLALMLVVPVTAARGIALLWRKRTFRGFPISPT